ncbi:MAG: hypothetical protein ACRD00_01845 [Thermoanaerobaculia bacterium]
MSLIDEALKRAQAAHQNEPRADGGARPWTPAPLPDRSQANRRRALQIGGLAAAVTIAGLGLFLLVRQGQDRGLAASSKESPKPVSMPAVPLPLPATADPPKPRPTGALGHLAAPAAASPGPSAPALQAAAPSDRPAPALVNGRTYVGSAVLPDGARIELGGIVYSESNATAVVNGRIVGAGSYVEGFAVVRIEPTRVQLEGNGLTIFLALK